MVSKKRNLTQYNNVSQKKYSTRSLNNSSSRKKQKKTRNQHGGALENIPIDLFSLVNDEELFPEPDADAYASRDGRPDADTEESESDADADTEEVPKEVYELELDANGNIKVNADGSQETPSKNYKWRYKFNKQMVYSPLKAIKGRSFIFIVVSSLILWFFEYIPE